MQSQRSQVGYATGVVGVAAFVLFFTPLLVFSVELPWPKTVYASGYSTLQYSRIMIGDSEQLVYERLGQPLDTDEYVSTYCMNFERGYIEVDRYSDEVVAVNDPDGFLNQTPVDGERDLTRVSRTEGLLRLKDPQNLLHAPSVRQWTLARLSARLGAYTGKRAEKREVTLVYSRPVGAGDYWQRWLIVDADSRMVVDKISGYYWD